MSRTSDEPSPDAASRLAELGRHWTNTAATEKAARAELRAYVVACLDAGNGSVRTLAKAAGLNKNTVQKWSDERPKP